MLDAVIPTDAIAVPPRGRTTLVQVTHATRLATALPALSYPMTSYRDTGTAVPAGASQRTAMAAVPADTARPDGTAGMSEGGVAVGTIAVAVAGEELRAPPVCAHTLAVR